MRKASRGDIQNDGFTGRAGLLNQWRPRARRLSRYLGLAAGMVTVAGSASAQIAIPASGIINTVAGNSFAGDGGPATAARLNIVGGVALDSSGNIYIADSNNNCIRKLAFSTGVITTIAGSPAAGYSGDNGPATSARLEQPDALALDASGNLYIADTLNNVIREVTVAGTIKTIAGNGIAGYSGDAGAATAAELNGPYGVAVDSHGNVYIADSGNNVVRKVTVTTNVITTVVGNGTAGYTGDSIAATSAELSYPYGVTVDSSGNLYIADYGNYRIRKVNTSGLITTVAGNGNFGFSGDGGPATSAELFEALAVSVDSKGNLYLVDAHNQRIREVSGSTGIITTVVGNGLDEPLGDGMPATSAFLNYPEDVVVDPSGNLYIADTFDSRVRKVTASTGLISTVAGIGTYGGDGQAATNALISFPFGIRTDPSGNLYIVDANEAIRKVVASTGIITTIAGNETDGSSGDGKAATSAQLDNPVDVALDSSGNLYIGDSGNMRVRKVTVATGVITTVAGNGTAGYSGDGGAATSAALNYPDGVAIDAAGNLYIADSLNNVIRKVTAATGIISTVAGNNVAGYAGDGGSATKASLNNPWFVIVDATGNLYIADSGNNVVREVVAASGVIKTVVGTGVEGYSGDGGAATSATLDFPQALALDYGGNLYIADCFNNRVRKVRLSTTGVITTIAGTGVDGFYGDGMPAVSAQLAGPSGVWVDASANIFIADSDNERIRVVGKAVPSVAPVLSWPKPATIGYGAALSATQLNATASVAGTFTYTPAAGQILPVGSNTLSVSFVPVDGVDYTTATATTTVSVIQGVPKITWAAPAAITAGTPLSATQLNATANTPGTFTYSPPVGTVLAQGTQTLTVDFAPTNTSEYAPATASVTLTVNASSTAGIIHTFAGTGVQGYNGDSIAATSAELHVPFDIIPDSSGNVYIADNQNFRIRKVAAATGIITTIAGNGVNAVAGLPPTLDYHTQAYAGNGGPATSVALGYVEGMAVDTSGNVYYADQILGVIRKITVATDIITTVAGNGQTGVYSGDGGAATSAALYNPSGVAVDAAGNLYIADSSNDVIRKVTALSGVISTIAGKGSKAGYTGDNGLALSATLNYPYRIALDGSGNVYFSDENNNVVRKINVATAIITTYAGNGVMGYAGGLATSAELNTPAGISLNSAGDLFIADNGNRLVREVFAATGLIATVAGTGVSGYNGDGIPATTAELGLPDGVRVAANGNIYIADGGGARVRVIGPVKQTPAFSWPPPAPINYGTPLSATQLDASSNGLAGTITYSEPLGTVLKVGTYSLSALFIPASSDYSAETAKVSLTVNRAPAPVSWTQPANVANGTALSATQLNATSTIPGTFVYSPGVGTVLTLGPHTLSVTFTPTDTIDYTATTATVTITVSSGTATYDKGTVSFVSGTTKLATVSYGQGSTAASIASALAAAVNAASGSPVKLIALDDALYMTAVTPGAGGNSISYSIVNGSFDTTDFSAASFPGTTISGNLDGGGTAGTAGGTVYSYSDSYDPVGNMVGSNDLAMGNWTFTPDTLNRLSTATGVPALGGAKSYYCWSYDAFGNRTLQGVSSAAFASGPPACTPQTGASYEAVWAHVSTANNNRFSNTQQATGGVIYDGAGNILNDGVNQYLYDGEGRICATSSEGVGTPVLTGYIYNAQGQRVGKGAITAWSCDPTVNGYQAMSDYILGPSGEQVTEMGMKSSGGMAWQHTNVFVLGQLLATYDNDGLHFYLNDPLGTRRAQTDYAGVLEQNCLSLPFGDALSCTHSLQFPTEHHFTGKERDAESGLDYFGARYYGSNLGRFMSPDSGADATLGIPVPFADLEDPQSLNLYSYVNSNPLRFTDPDGQSHWGSCNDGSDAQCLFGDYNGEASRQNGRTVYWNAANGNWDNNDPTKMNDGRVNDLSGGQLLMFVPVGKLVGPLVGSAMSKVGEALTNALGRSGENVAESGAKALLSSGSKQAAKDIIDALPDGAQKASAKRAVAAATRSESVSISQSSDGSVTISRTRSGFDGSQTFTKTIDLTGASKTVQTAVDSSGAQVHYDPKN